MSILIWNFLFSNGEFPSRILRDFFRIALFSKKLYFRRNFIFGEAIFYSVTFQEATSSHFFSTTTSIWQLHFGSSYFFRAAAFFEELRFRKSHSLAVFIFFRIPIFLSETSTKEPLLENRKCFRAVSSRNSYFFCARITYNNVIYRRDLLFKQVLLHSISFYRRATFSKKLTFQKRSILNYLLFLKSYLFRVATFQ